DSVPRLYSSKPVNSDSRSNRPNSMQTTEMEPAGISHTSPSTSDSKPKTSVTATAPGQLRVIKRNGTVVPYTDDKIAVAVTKAFLAVEGGNAAASSRVHET